VIELDLAPTMKNQRVTRLRNGNNFQNKI
jgi:hypothetical protein